MTPGKNIYHTIDAGKSLVAVVMIFLLLFLTTANYFFFRDDPRSSSLLIVNEDEESAGFPGSPSGPDEKAPGGPVSISEEYLHGHIEITDFFLSNRLFKHLITASEKIELVHFELLSPPPEC